MHPTHFENLKVAFENQLYDLDNIDQVINIVGRSDQIELAAMSRQFRISFTLTDAKSVKSEVELSASLKELANELLGLDGGFGCDLFVHFYKEIAHIDRQCEQINNVLQEIWEPSLPIEQVLRFTYDIKKAEKQSYLNQTTIRFNRKLNERHMNDIPQLLAYVMKSLRELDQI
ncbi:hypothetical protein [Bacillus sp. JCM 19034]|uniref:hypothetical protein n=1 Tax=Bacillus sp. JCM 19034 TaxID=1481928 RepID=UPI000784BCC8|nr:hypothetical protein [Bacillus sp. JCM 19034]